jgi:Ino eighty subunit 1
MRTVLRSYHPIPSLQKTEMNLQDAPRIKNCLKACLLPEEAGSPPSTPVDISAKGVCWRGYSLYFVYLIP